MSKEVYDPAAAEGDYITGHPGYGFVHRFRRFEAKSFSVVTMCGKHVYAAGWDRPMIVGPGTDEPPVWGTVTAGDSPPVQHRYTVCGSCDRSWRKAR